MLAVVLICIGCFAAGLLAGLVIVWARRVSFLARHTKCMLCGGIGVVNDVTHQYHADFLERLGL